MFSRKGEINIPRKLPAKMSCSNLVLEAGAEDLKTMVAWYVVTPPESLEAVKGSPWEKQASPRAARKSAWFRKTTSSSPATSSADVAAH